MNLQILKETDHQGQEYDILIVDSEWSLIKCPPFNYLLHSHTNKEAGWVVCKGMMCMKCKTTAPIELRGFAELIAWER